MKKTICLLSLLSSLSSFSGVSDCLNNVEKAIIPVEKMLELESSQILADQKEITGVITPIREGVNFGVMAGTYSAVRATLREYCRRNHIHK